MLLLAGVDAPSEARAQTGWREARAGKGEASIKARRNPTLDAELSTIEASPYRARASRPARQLLLSCRATPPLRGGECAPPIRHRNYEKQYSAPGSSLQTSMPRGTHQYTVGDVVRHATSGRGHSPYLVLQIF